MSGEQSGSPADWPALGDIRPHELSALDQTYYKAKLAPADGKGKSLSIRTRSLQRSVFLGNSLKMFDHVRLSSLKDPLVETCQRF